MFGRLLMADSVGIAQGRGTMSQPTTTDRQPDFGSRSFISGRDLGRIGTALLLIGLAFLYRWGVIAGWINELARVGAGGLLSLALLAAGISVSYRRPSFSALAEGAGIAGLFMTAFAANQVYGLVTDTTAFVQLIAVSVLAFGLAVGQRRESMAIIGVLGAMSAPLLIGGSLDVWLGDAGYLAVVILTVGAILTFQPWGGLFAVTVAGTGVLVAVSSNLIGLNLIPATRMELLVLLGAAVVGLYGGPTLAVFLGNADRKNLIAVLSGATVTLGAFGVGTLVWGFGMNPGAWAIVAIALAAMHIGVAVAATTNENYFRTIQFVPAVTLLAAAAGLVLEGNVLLLVWAAQAVGLIIIGRRDDTGAASVLGGVAYAFIALVALARLIEPTTGSPVFNGQGLATLGVFLLFFVIAAFMPSETNDNIVARSLVLFAGYVAVLSWQFAEFVRFGAGQAAVSIGWAVTGLGLVVWAWNRSPAVRNVGLATLLGVVAKLFLVDLAAASGGWKIVLFMGVGATLLGLGYLLAGSEEADQNEESNTPDEPTPAMAGSEV